jgi:hypothetical protein
LIGADLYFASPSVKALRHGEADRRNLIPENNRHCRCDDDSSRNDSGGYGVVHPEQYALRIARFQPGSLPQSLATGLVSQRASCLSHKCFPKGLSDASGAVD